MYFIWIVIACVGCWVDTWVGWFCGGRGHVYKTIHKGNLWLAGSLIWWCVSWAWLSLYLLLRVSMAMEWELSLFRVPKPGCVCVWGELMRTECLSFPSFPNPICSNKRLKGKEKETLLVKGGGIITYILGQHFSTCNPFSLCLSFCSDKRSQANVVFIFLKPYFKKKKRRH